MPTDEQITEWTNKAYEWLASFGLDLLGAILIFLIGKMVAKWLTKLLRRALSTDRLNQTLVSFLCNLAYFGLLTVVILAALNNVGIQMASFITILGAAGLAVGLALQGSLSNFAAGVLLVFFQPFKVGDVITAAGEFGTVEDIQIFCTILVTPQGHTVIMPNSSVAGGNITNFTRKGRIRVDMTIGISYDADIRTAKAIIEKIVAEDERVLKDPAPVVAVKELGDNSVNFACNVWAAPSDKWGIWFDVHEKVKYAFDEADIGIPYPQRDVHLYTHDAA